MGCTFVLIPDTESASTTVPPVTNLICASEFSAPSEIDVRVKSIEPISIPPTLSMQLQSPAPVHFPRREHDTYSLWLLASDSNTTEQETELEETTSDVMQTKSEIGGFPS